MTCSAADVTIPAHPSAVIPRIHRRSCDLSDFLGFLVAEAAAAGFTDTSPHTVHTCAHSKLNGTTRQLACCCSGAPAESVFTQTHLGGSRALQSEEMIH